MKKTSIYLFSSLLLIDHIMDAWVLFLIAYKSTCKEHSILIYYLEIKFINIFTLKGYVYMKLVGMKLFSKYNPNRAAEIQKEWALALDERISSDCFVRERVHYKLNDLQYEVLYKCLEYRELEVNNPT